MHAAAPRPPRPYAPTSRDFERAARDTADKAYDAVELHRVVQAIAYLDDAIRFIVKAHSLSKEARPDLILSLTIWCRDRDSLIKSEAAKTS